MAAVLPITTHTEHPLCANRILVVEDASAEAMRTEAILKQLGYSVCCATDGVKALEILQQESIDIVLSDWRMPRMDGLTLCRTIRTDSRYGHPHFVLLTGRSTSADLIAGMDAGADDFITKPFKTEELRVRVQAGQRIVSLRAQLQQRHQELEQAFAQEKSAHERLYQDLQAAAGVQREFLPPEEGHVEGVNIAAAFQPAESVAGDAYNYFPLNERFLAFYLLDVAGHGIPAAMLSVSLSRLLTPAQGLSVRARGKRAGAPECWVPSAPHKVVQRLNRHFRHGGDHARYFTMIYGVVDCRTGKAGLCQAGHPHPILQHADGRCEQLGAGGMPVGLIPDANYELIEFQMDPGDRLFLYSDGVTDHPNPRGDRFGQSRLLDRLRQARTHKLAKLPQYMLNELNGWNPSPEDPDDISMLALERV